MERAAKEHILRLVGEQNKRKAERSFYEFLQQAWPILEPKTPFCANWHYVYICDMLQDLAEAVGEGRPKTHDVIINVPPRSAKSTTCTIALNAWAWIHFPHIKFLTASYDGALAIEHAVDTRRLISSPWYQERWANRFTLASDQNVKSFFENDKSGHRIATSVGGSGTGRGADIIIVDDPQSSMQAESELSRKTVVDWWEKTLYSRLNNQEVGFRILVQQRLHESDLTGYLTAKKDPKIFHLCLPAERSDDIRPPELAESYVDGLLHPGILSKAVLTEVKKQGSYTYSSQYMQRPSPAEGGVFKRQYWKYWLPEGMSAPPMVLRLPDGSLHTHETVPLPSAFDCIVDAWDMTFKGTAGSDRVSGQKWGAVDTRKFLLSIRLGEMGFLDARSAVTSLWKESPAPTYVIVEDTANGPAVIETLKTTIPCLLPVHVAGKGSKMARATDASKAVSVVAQAEAGNLILPHPAVAAWVESFVDEFADFPFAKHDDNVDAAVHAVRKLSEPLPMLYTMRDLDKDLQK